jgi:hypothetical protein
VTCRTFWRFGRVFIRKGEVQLEQPSFPDCLLSPWYADFPVLEVNHTIRTPYGFGEKAKWMIFPPLLPVSPYQRLELGGHYAIRTFLPGGD